MMPAHKPCAFLFTAAFLVAAIAGQAAKDSAGPLDLAASGWVSGSGYARPATDKVLASAGLRGGLALDGEAFGAFGLRLSLEGYSNLAGAPDTTNWSLSRPDPLSISWSGNDRLQAALDLKEAWLEYAVGDLDLRVGKQLLAWGLADGNNPTDNVNARHVGTRLVSTLDEQKMGTIAANLVYNLPGNAGSIQGLVMPFSVPNDLPKMTMDITIPGVPSNRIIMEADSPPDFAVDKVEGGLRSLVYLEIGRAHV